MRNVEIGGVNMSKRSGIRFMSLALAAGVCLLMLVCAGPASAGEPAIPQSGLPLPPSVLPVIVLQGSDYNMGYQYYQQVDQLFGSSVLKAMQVPGGFSDQQLLALKAYQYYIQQDTPEYIEMFEGMAAAATDAGVPLTYTEVLANYVGTRAYPGTEPPGSGSETLPPTCSAWAAWGKTTTDGSLITGQEMDPPWGDFGNNDYVAIVAYPATGNAYINVTEPGQLASIPVMPGINDKGVSTTGNLGGAWRDVDYGKGAYGLKAGLIAHILRFADSAAAGSRYVVVVPPVRHLEHDHLGRQGQRLHRRVHGGLPDRAQARRLRRGRLHLLTELLLHQRRGQPERPARQVLPARRLGAQSPDMSRHRTARATCNWPACAPTRPCTTCSTSTPVTWT